MKSFRNVIMGLGLFALPVLLHAQLTVQSSPDSIVQITAEAEGLTQVDPADLPLFGTYYVVEANGIFPPYPCQPPDLSQPIYAITDDIFLVDQTGGQVTPSPLLLGRTQSSSMLTANPTAALTAAVNVLGNRLADLIERIQEVDFERNVMRAMGMDVPGFGDGGGDGGGYTNSYVGITIDTNGLWLEITNVSNGWSYLNLHNATNHVYAILTKTNLLDASWTIEQELWPVDMNCQPFTVQNFDRQTLFVRAEDWTGVDSDADGIPDWWAWKYFGVVNINATNQDAYGYTLLDDYQQGQNPNFFFFSIRPIQYVNNATPAIPLNIYGGTLVYMAVLANDYDTNDAVWIPYSTNMTANLNGGDGNYYVMVGLRGFGNDSPPSWQHVSLVLDTVPPVITFTNLASSTVSKTTINLQGFANETLSSVSFDVSNASGTISNQTGYLTGSYLDYNLGYYTTNYFTCPNANLVNGSNSIAVHAVDLAGNKTDIYLTLNCVADTSPSALNVIWPTDGQPISGSSFILQAQVNNPAASVSAVIVDASGNTNTIKGLVENNGAVWVNNLPLATGTNTVTVTAGLAASMTNSQTFTVVGNDIGLVINPLTQFNQSKITVTGSVADPINDCVFVNGIKAGYTNDAGDWEADDVPVSPGGTAAIKVEVYVGDPVLIGSQAQFAPQPVTVQTIGYRTKWHSEDTSDHFYFYQSWNYGINPYYPIYTGIHGSETIGSLEDYRLDWLAGVGGSLCDVGFSDNIPGPYNIQNSIGPEIIDLQTMGISWENAEVNILPSGGQPSASDFAYTNGPWVWKNRDINSEKDMFHNQTATRVQLLASGGQAAGVTNLYLVRFAAVDRDSLEGLYPLPEGLPPEAFQVCGQPLANTGETNASGGISDDAVWGMTAISAPAGQNVDVTPSFVTPPQANWDYYFDVQAIQLYPPTPDNNRDGNITLDNGDATTSAQPFRFWINDSKEGGDIATGAGDQIPGSSTPNYALNQVNGRSDLVNYFPVVLCLSNVMQILPLTNGWEYHLSQADSAVKLVYASFQPTNAYDYLTNLDSYGYGTNADEWVTNADTIAVTNSQIYGTKLDTNWLTQVQNNGGNGVLLLEGCAASTQPLVLEIWHTNTATGQLQLVGGVPMYISISGVEQMYRWVNLRGAIGAAQTRATDTSEPANNPDAENLKGNFVFVHGYNVTEEKARGWSAEIFKRLWQSHSHAKFYAVDWQGSESYNATFDITPNYQTNVANAFLTAPALKDLLAGLSGQTTLAGHSLGNMVCLSAINDSGAAPANYFMIDAAVPMEAVYDSLETDASMVHPDWSSISNGFWASKWFNIWPSGDARNTLTWSNRLSNFGSTAVYNFYSSGEEVLRTDSNPPPSGALSAIFYNVLNYLSGQAGFFTWVWQEKLKGRTAISGVLGSTHGGWEFNDDLDSGYVYFVNGLRTHIPPSVLTGSILQTNAFFDMSVDTALFTTNSSGADYATANKNRILSDAIPALTLPIGANYVTNLDERAARTVNFDMQTLFENNWPSDRGTPQYPIGTTAFGEWHHSDIKDVAYPFNYKVFNHFVNTGNLK